VIGVLTTEVSGAPDLSADQANPEREVYLPITHAFVCDAFRRRWSAVAVDLVAAPRSER
jgi:hypothetical protein